MPVEEGEQRRGGQAVEGGLKERSEAVHVPSVDAKLRRKWLRILRRAFVGSVERGGRWGRRPSD
jgi:hypothetical protein